MKIYGQGFTLSPERRDELVRHDRKNAERIFPYIGGEEVNTSPTLDFKRYVINFGAMSLEDAERWQDLIRIVREDVKPERDKNKREVRKRYWWRFGEVAPALYKAIAPLKRCLVNSQVSKHLLFAFQPTDRVFGHTLYAYPFSDHAHFATLQSRIHEPWARLLASSMRNDLRYTASDCFETFPFPRDEAITPTSAVEHAGKLLYEARARFMVDTEQGLTKAYNALKDPENQDPRIGELRRLHEAMDSAVLEAYGWHDIEVPPYGTPVTADERRTLERFEDEVVDRLFALNHERAEDERRRGLGKVVAPAAANDTSVEEGTDDDPTDSPAAARSPKSAPRHKPPKGPSVNKTSAPPPSKPKRKTAAGGRKR